MCVRERETPFMHLCSWALRCLFPIRYMRAVKLPFRSMYIHSFIHSVLVYTGVRYHGLGPLLHTTGVKKLNAGSFLFGWAVW